jgi:hypothetical protein
VPDANKYVGSSAKEDHLFALITFIEEYFGTVIIELVN